MVGDDDGELDASGRGSFRVQSQGKSSAQAAVGGVEGFPPPTARLAGDGGSTSPSWKFVQARL